MCCCAPAAFSRKTQSCVSVTEGVFTTSEVSQGRSAIGTLRVCECVCVCLFVCLSNIWTSAAKTLQAARTSTGQLRWQVEPKEHPRGREEDEGEDREGEGKGRERGSGREGEIMTVM